MSLNPKLGFGIALGIIAAVGMSLPAALRGWRHSEQVVPTARVKRGTLETKVHTWGEVRSSRSAMLVAPAVGGALQIIHLMKTGTRVKAGDIVVEFDPSEQQFNLERNRSELQQAEEAMAKAKLDAAVQAAKDQVELLKAKFDVRRAELDVSKNELASAIDAKKNLLALEEAKRRLAQLQQDIQSRAASGSATLAVEEEKRNKARLAIEQAQQHIEEMRVRSPMSGIVAVNQNEQASGGFFFPGMVLPEYREGDTVFPGSFVAQVLDVAQMEVQTRVNEMDRANVNPGQRVEVRVDAMPEKVFSGRVKTVAGMASATWWSGEAARKFNATIQFDKPDEKLRVGVTAAVIIFGEEVKDALYLPRQAVFEKNGKPVIYAKEGRNFEARPAKIVRFTETHVVVDGVSEGAEAALVNPEEEALKPRETRSPLGPAVSGGGR